MRNDTFYWERLTTKVGCLRVELGGRTGLAVVFSNKEIEKIPTREAHMSLEESVRKMADIYIYIHIPYFIMHPTGAF